MSGDPLFQAARLHKQGRIDEARRLYKRALKRRPNDPDTLHLAGVAEHQGGAHGRAIRLIKRAIAADGQQAVFHYNLGLALLAADRADEARSALRRALELQPAYPDALGALANLHLAGGDVEEAGALYERALSLNPDQPRVQNNYGTVCRVQARAKAARAAFERAVSLDPELAEGWENLASMLVEPDEAVAVIERLAAGNPASVCAQLAAGRALERAGHTDQAADRFRRAVALHPDSLEALLSLGNALLALRCEREAIVPLNRATELAPEDPRPVFLLGAALYRMAFLDAAEECLRRSLALDPEQPAVSTHLGWLLVSRGALAEAAEQFEAALATDPGHVAAIGGRAAVTDRLGESRRAVEELHSALERHPEHPALVRVLANVAGSDAGEMRPLLERALEASKPGSSDHAGLRYTLAALLDRLGEYDGAFEHAARANALKPVRFDAQQNEQMVQRMRRVFAPAAVDGLARSGNDDRLPILVVGLPRSGTTLVEQILASHPWVHGAGERHELNTLTTHLGERLGSSLEYPEVVLEMTDDQMRELGEAYAGALRGLAPAGVARVVDKMPPNHWHVGTISRALPSANVVHCTRDARDVAVSLFMHDFVGLHRFAYDLSDIGTYTRHYLAMMDHWRALPGVSMLDLSYEDLVSDPETQVRRLLEFVGLPFDPACLAPHETRRVVSSASFRQVRRPIYSSSVGRWKHYASRLAPFLDAVGDAITEPRGR